MRTVQMNLHSYRENHHQNFQVNFIYVRKLLTEKGMWKVLFIFAHWGKWLYLWFVSMNSLSLFWLHSNFLFIILFFFNYYLKVFWHLFILPAWAIKFRTLKLEANICSMQNYTNDLHKVWIRVTICCAAKCGICE